MIEVRHLDNAPIVEALIDFRVNIPTEFNVQIFSSLGSDFASKYPKRESLTSGNIEFRIEDGKPVVKSNVDKGIQGYIYKSADGKDVAQFRMDGFTFSRLNPYTSWEQVFGEASKLWDLYCSKAASDPVTVTRIAVRYINRLDIPALEDLGEYLKAPLKIPEELPQEISEFLVRVVIHESELTANIIQALDKSTKPNYVGVILDIDVYKQNQNGFDITNVLSEFTKLRDLKNRIFFASITDKMGKFCK